MHTYNTAVFNLAYICALGIYKTINLVITMTADDSVINGA